MCRIEGCENPVHALSLCQNHYRQAQRLVRGKKKPGPKPDPSKPRSRYADRPDKARHGREPRTHCPQGHEYTEENSYISPKGARYCKACRKERMRERRAVTPGVGAGGVNAAKTHCPQEHEYNDENTIRSKDGKRRACRTCAKVNGAIQNVKRYGISPEDVLRKMEHQESACAICRVDFSLVPPHIDHDHACCDGGFSCGKCVRSLLCSDCNQGLGKFHDSPEILRAAAAYLESFLVD